MLIEKKKKIVGRRPEQTFFQREHADGQQAHEKMLNVANHQGNANQNHNQISPHTSQNGYHQKEHKKPMQQRCGEKGTLLYYWWECKLVESLWKTEQRFLRKLKIELLYDPAIPLLGIYLKTNKQTNTNLKKHMHPNVHGSIIYNCQNMKATCVHQQMNG